MGDKYFDPPQITKSSTDLVIEKIIKEYLKDYPLNIINCDELKYAINSYLRDYLARTNELIKQKENYMRDTVKNVCDLFEERIEKLEKTVYQKN